MFNSEVAELVFDTPLVKGEMFRRKQLAYMLAGFPSLLFPSIHDDMSLIDFPIDAIEGSISKTNVQVLCRW